MTNFPNQIDTDLELPAVYDNINEVGSDAINAIRAAMFAVEETLGRNPQGTASSVSARLSVSLNDDGTIKPSSLIGIGLVALPITNGQVSSTAAIDESKLNLIYSTQFLFNLCANLQESVDLLNDFVSIEGIKIAPHVAGTGFRHQLSHIDVDAGALSRVDINTGVTGSRNLTNSYTFASQLSNDFLNHVRADGINNTTTPPQNQAHNATGISINPHYFISVPQTVDDLQSFAEYVDSSSLTLLGSRTQNLYSNGIPRASRATSLINDQIAEPILDSTPAHTFLLYGSATSPVDDIDHGDDVILLQPTSGVLASNVFDAQFSQVKPGDYITITYDGYTPTVIFTIDSTKKFLNDTTRSYVVRINGKNLKLSTEAVIRIDRPHYHTDRFNSLAISPANNLFNETPSLVLNSARGATALGINFNKDQLDTAHYNLYLALYPTGNPLQTTHFLPPIDVTGNNGVTPGAYTLDSIVFTINEAFRQPGFNYRFNAFIYKGQIGITLADPYNDASFSIISGATGDNGDYGETTNTDYPHNVVDNYAGYDALGFGKAGSNLASPPFSSSYATPLSALTSPTIILAPLRRNFFYVDGVERDNFALETLITRDGYGDGYWNAIITSRTPLSNRVEVTYEIPLDLSISGLKIGKTIVVQPSVGFGSGSYNFVDYGRFIISNVVFDNCHCGDPPTTIITVYDGVHGVGVSPYSSSENIPVKIYFNDDSLSFNNENVSDLSENQSFKRLFEVYMSSDGKSYSHERARYNTQGTDLTIDSVNGFVLYSDLELAPLQLLNVSPKLRGYANGQYKKITLFIESYDEVTGIFVAYLCNYQYPSTYLRLGPTIIGKKGEIVRLYDDTLVDYIEVKFDLSVSINSFTNKQIDIQIYNTLELNQEKMLIGKCLLNDSTNKMLIVEDFRQFGNVSEQQLSTSALNYISAPQKLLNENGIIRGFEFVGIDGNAVTLTGGTALIDGKIVEFNDKTVVIPPLSEVLYPSFSTTINDIKWYLCANSNGDLEFVASTDYSLASVGTYGSLDHDRIIYVKNNNSPSTPAYPIRSAYLQKIFLEMKDLIPLYIVYNLGESIDSRDIRRFTTNGYGGMASPMILANNGSYRSIPAILNTLQESYANISYSILKTNCLGNKVIVRDRFEIDNWGFNFPTEITFEGNGVFSVVSIETQMCHNVKFKDLNFDVSSKKGLILDSYVSIDSCNFNYTFDASGNSDYLSTRPCNPLGGCIYADTSTNNSKYDISITNCNFSSNRANRFPFISFLLSDQVSYYQNVNILNNYFTYSSGNSDPKAAINFSCTSTDMALIFKTRLTDCKIENNVCQQDQMIVMSGTPNGSSKITDMPVPVNVSISKNVCGAICFLTRDGGAYNANTSTNKIYDKEGCIIISENTTKYIFNGTIYGLINVIGSSNRVTYDIIDNVEIFSSSMMIKNNICSWIHIGVKNPSTTFSALRKRPSILIEGNQVTAFPSILSTYWSSITPLNVGLIVDSVEGS